jgi:hypothetical protein
MSAFGAASPYLDKASQTVPEVISNYLNPYAENVTNRARDLATRTWNEDIIPDINDTFTRAGQFASKGMQKQYLDKGRDVVEGLQGQSNALLADAYKNSALTAGTDLDRQRLLAGQAGDATSNDMSTLVNTANGQNDLASLIQKLNLGDASALQAAGAAQQGQTQKNLDTAYADFIAQRDYPKDQLTWLQGQLSGIDAGKTTTGSESKPLAGAEYGSSPLSQISSGISNVAGIWDLLKNWGN